MSFKRCRPTSPLCRFNKLGLYEVLPRVLRLTTSHASNVIRVETVEGGSCESADLNVQQIKVTAGQTKDESLHPVPSVYDDIRGCTRSRCILHLASESIKLRLL